MEPETFTLSWEEIQRDFSGRNDRVLSECVQAWVDLKAILQRSDSELEKLHSENSTGSRIDVLHNLLGHQADVLLLDSYDLLEKRRPAQRVVAALTDYDTSSADLLRLAPLTIEIGREELFRLAGSDRVPLWHRIGQSNRKAHVRIRDCIRTSLCSAALNASPAQGEFLLVLAQSKLHIVTAWHIWRQAGLEWLAGSGDSSPVGLADSISWWRRQCSDFYDSMERIISAMRARAGEGADQLRLAPMRKPLSGSRLNKMSDRRQNYLQYWSKLHRVAHMQIELEVESLRVARDTLSETDNMNRSLESEHQS